MVVNYIISIVKICFKRVARNAVHRVIYVMIGCITDVMVFSIICKVRQFEITCDFDF